MKRMKKIVSLLTAAVFCLLSLASLSLTANAEEPVTYYVRYIDDEWRFQTGSVWDEQGFHRELYYLKQDIKDGDLLVIDGTGARLILDLNVRLSNLTSCHANEAIVTAKGIDNCYILENSVFAVNGDVTNAYVYDNARCTFNNNVTNLEIIGKENLLKATVSVMGTVNHLKGQDGVNLHYELYDFASGKLVVENGSIKTDAAYYSTTPQSTTAAAPSTAAPASSAPAAQAPSAAANTAASSEYDDVPKTGEANICIWLLGIAAVCLLGRYELNKR